MKCVKLQASRPQISKSSKCRKAGLKLEMGISTSLGFFFLVLRQVWLQMSLDKARKDAQIDAASHRTDYYTAGFPVKTYSTCTRLRGDMLLLLVTAFSTFMANDGHMLRSGLEFIRISLKETLRSSKTAFSMCCGLFIFYTWKQCFDLLEQHKTTHGHEVSVGYL